METIWQLFRVLWAPFETLHAVSQKPRIIAPLILLTLFAATETAIVFSKLDPGALRLQQFEREGYADKISEDDKAIHAQNARNNRTFAASVTAVRELLMVTVVAGVFYLVLGVGRGVSFKSFLAVTAFAFIPGIFHSIAIIATVLSAQPTLETLERAGSISPVLFLDPASVSRQTYMALASLDVVSIWIVALLIVGYGFILRDRTKPVVRIFAVGGMYCVWSFVYVAIRLTFA